MELILKRGVEYTPLIFKHPDLQNRKCCKLIKDDTLWKNTEQLMDFFIDYANTSMKSIRGNERIKISNHYFFSGGMHSEENITALVVYKNSSIEDKYVIIQEEFFKVSPSHLAKVKKHINANGISSRSKMLVWNKNRIYSEFQELLSPTLKDYDSTTQISTSNTFLVNQRKLISYKPIVFPDELEVGDYGIVIKNSYGGCYDIGTFVIITKINNSNSSCDIRSLTSSITNTYNLETDLRKATQEEINSNLGIDESVGLIPGTPTTISDVDFEEEEDDGYEAEPEHGDDDNIEELIREQHSNGD